MNHRLAAERELIRQTLDVAELEELARQSQEMLDAAPAAAQRRAQLGTGEILDVPALTSQGRCP